MMVTQLQILFGVRHLSHSLDRDLSSDGGRFQRIQQIIPEHSKQPGLRTQDPLSLATGQEVAEKYFLHSILCTLATTHDQDRVTEKPGGVFRIRLGDLDLEVFRRLN